MRNRGLESGRPSTRGQTAGFGNLPLRQDSERGRSRKTQRELWQTYYTDAQLDAADDPRPGRTQGWQTGGARGPAFGRAAERSPTAPFFAFDRKSDRSGASSHFRRANPSS